jgi:small conductance mechanosensitive channel
MLSATTAWLADVPTAASPSPTDTTDPIIEAPLPALAVDDPQSWWDWFVGLPLQILLIVVIGAVVLVVVRRMIRRIANHIADGTPLLERRGWRSIGESQVGTVLLRANPLATARRAQRARTIGSVLGSAANVIIGMTIVLMVLGQLGVNLAPFLASAGIAGVAIGFGAQSLVKDFLSGTFMLLEDQYGVGDVVDFGEVVGVVEEMALRVTKVRDLNGTLWYVRNGEILRTGNKTQEWGRAVVDVRVAYDTDEKLVRAALLAAAATVQGDPVLGEHCMEDPEVIGIDVLTAEAIQLKVQIKTQPGQQWDVARALRAEVRSQLSAAGIPLAGTQQVVVYEHPAPARPGAANPPEGRKIADRDSKDSPSATQ